MKTEPRTPARRKSNMQINQYIVIKRTGGKYAHKYSSRLAKNSPGLDSNEIAMKLSIEVPDDIFDKPTLQAKITVPKEAVSRPVIESTVIDNVEQIIKQNTGFEVKLEVVDSRASQEE